MTYTGDEFKRMQAKYRLTGHTIIAALNISAGTLNNWRSGHTSPPAYIPMTLRAIQLGLRAVDDDRMIAYQDNIFRIINVPPATAQYWYTCNRFPIAARFAVALYDYRQRKGRNATANVVTPYQIKRLRHILIGQYIGDGGGWRSRMIMGKAMPDIRHTLVTTLRERGYVKIDGRYLKVTEKGMKLLYK